jgi:ferredoxin-NADP reductase
MGIIIMATRGVSSDMTQTSKPTDWRIGTVTEIVHEAPGLRSYTFAFDSLVKHDAGQHYEIRLTAEDGYQAARLYSAAMPANGTANTLELTIALMPHGEVSSYIFNYVKIGSQVEIRGPLGRYFIWKPEQKDPILLVGGGSGVIPLRCIRLERQHAASTVPMKLLYSARTYVDTAYKYELFPRGGEPSSDVIMTFTEEPPTGWQGYARRIDAAMLEEVLSSFSREPRAYVCGITPLVENVTQLLVKAGLDPANISAERFGSTS